MSIQIKIAEIIQQKLTEDNHPLLSMINGKTLEDICHQIYYSYRGSGTSTKGFRLSKEGLLLMKTCFKSYDYVITKATMPQLLYLDRISTFPYFIDSRHFVTFDSDLAMMMTLCESRIQALIDANFRIKFGQSSFQPDL